MIDHASNCRCYPCTCGAKARKAAGCTATGLCDCASEEDHRARRQRRANQWRSQAMMGNKNAAKHPPRITGCYCGGKEGCLEACNDSGATEDERSDAAWQAAHDGRMEDNPDGA